MRYLSRLLRSYLLFDDVLASNENLQNKGSRRVLVAVSFSVQQNEFENYLFSNLSYPSFSGKHTVRSDNVRTVF